MIKNNSVAPELMLRGGVKPYESPFCMVMSIDFSGPLCQSLEILANPEIDFGNELNLGLGGDL